MSTENFLMGTSKVQTFQTNQSHNNDITNMNGLHTDRLNEKVSEDDVTNVNDQSADDLVDDLADESHKKISQMHQMLSQQQQVVQTTPGPVNQTEKGGSSHQRHNRQHNDGKVTSLGSLLGMPVKLNGIADKKQQSNLHPQVTY